MQSSDGGGPGGGGGGDRAPLRPAMARVVVRVGLNNMAARPLSRVGGGGGGGGVGGGTPGSVLRGDIPGGSAIGCGVGCAPRSVVAMAGGKAA